MPAVIKVCACSATYTLTQWLGLFRVGVMRIELDGDDAIELRDCSSCLSTIAVPLADLPVDVEEVLKSARTIPAEWSCVP